MPVMIIRMLEDPAITNEVTFAYMVKDSMGNSLTFWIAKNGISVDEMNKIPERPDYLLLDNVDSALNMRGEKLNLGLTSGDKEVLKELRKRVSEAGVLGKYHAMQALDLEAMRLMFPALPTADLQFRFDVLGGNPRRFRDEEPASVSEEMEHLVYLELQSCITMFFGSTYNHKMETPDGYCQERFASTFLRLVAGALDSKDDASLRDALKRIVGIMDAIVSPNLLQMTISHKHGGAVDKLPDIATALGVPVSGLLLIFVVESVEKAWAFNFPELQEIRMVVTPRDTEQALRTGH
ncbi:hypothetical protein B484DRAFT_408451 [Ochromonadaceae sp. CCMP2298]|nr:hypothetical protein B484DRAFT_408451 [Ochromonadaceae sp. CCMP2298]